MRSVRLSLESFIRRLGRTRNEFEQITLIHKRKRKREKKSFVKQTWQTVTIYQSQPFITYWSKIPWSGFSLVAKEVWVRPLVARLFRCSWLGSDPLSWLFPPTLLIISAMLFNRDSLRLPLWSMASRIYMPWYPSAFWLSIFFAFHGCVLFFWRNQALLSRVLYVDHWSVENFNTVSFIWDQENWCQYDFYT